MSEAQRNLRDLNNPYTDDEEEVEGLNMGGDSTTEDDDEAAEEAARKKQSEKSKWSCNDGCV